ncbi:MAG: hypothetical protein K1X82_00480 [Bacteroidia bacterium]|nr:hypothetical protein [Bacteroidia bacterium]
MKPKTILIFVVVLATILILSNSELMAQCAMCRANVKTNLNDNDGIGGVGHTLNNAILYLMAVPYLLISSVFYVFNKEKVDNWVTAKWNSFRSGSKSGKTSVEA